MARFDAQLHWIEGQIPRMEASIEHWCGVNSGSHNRAGIERVGDEAFEGVEDHNVAIIAVSLRRSGEISDPVRAARFQSPSTMPPSSALV